MTATYRRTPRKRELKKLVQKGTAVEDPVPWHLHRHEKALRDVCKEENLCVHRSSREAYALWLQKDNAHHLHELFIQKRSCSIMGSSITLQEEIVCKFTGIV